MKNKNGFTLVELLAVIVVLAIIMIIAIPSVLDVMNNARKNSFILYVDKVVTAVQTQYMYDANSGSIQGAGYYVYDITQDLNLTSTGNYKGYVVVDATDVDKVQYVVSLYDNNYQLLNYNITLYNMPTVETESLQPYNVDTVGESASNAYRACKAWVPESEKETANCYNRKGYLIVEGESDDTNQEQQPTEPEEEEKEVIQYPIGELVTIGEEQFNIIDQTDTTIIMLAKYNLGTNYRQSKTENAVDFSSVKGWEYTPGPKDIDIQAYKGPVKTYVNNYVTYLREATGDENLTGTLITVNQLRDLGCVAPADYSNDEYNMDCRDSKYKSWLAIDQKWWTRSAVSNHSSQVFRIWYEYTISAAYYKYSFDGGIYDSGVRPVIEMSRSVIEK